MAASALRVRQGQLEKFHSKVTAPQMRALYEKFDIPRAFVLSATTKSQAVYDHDAGRTPVYVKHLEYGLRLPLHPFLRRVFEVLGVSPLQMKSNSIATLVGFVVICHWLGVEQTLNLLGHLVSVKVHQREAHYYLQVLGGFKIIADPPELNKDWKERFMWVSGDDSHLGCSHWPEVAKEALKTGPLSSTERQVLERIKAYSGSRKMEALLDNLVLWVVVISSTPTAKDEERAAMLTLVSEEATEGPTTLPAEVQEELFEGPSARPTKCLRLDLAPEEAAEARALAVDVAARLVGSKPATAEAEKRKRPRKVVSRGSRRRTEMAETEVVFVDDRSPAREKEAKIQVAEAAGEGEIQAEAEAPTEAEVAPDTSAEPTHRQGKEPAAKEASPIGGLESQYPHRIGEIEPEKWDQLRMLLIGSSRVGPRYDKEPTLEHRYKPTRHLD